MIERSAAGVAAATWSWLSEPGDPDLSFLAEWLGGPVPAVERLRSLTPPGAAGSPAGGDRARAALARRFVAARAERLAEVDTWGDQSPDGRGPGRGPRGGAEVIDGVLRRLQALDIDRELDRADRLGVGLLMPGDRHWPSGLDDLFSVPPCLWVKGPGSAGDLLAGLRTAGVAVVGSREATGYGRTVATDLGADLAGHGWTVVSGGAIGIDVSAHRGALAMGGPTVAVLAGGVDRLYPSVNGPVLLDIAATGALVSEVGLGCVPSRHRFLARNRLIAAMTAGTVVVEAGLRSGSLNTMGYAERLGRPIGAVPGPVTSITSAGCNARIRQHRAELIGDAAEVLELVGPLGLDLALPRRRAPDTTLDQLGPLAARVFAVLPVRVGAALDDLCTRAGLGIGETRVALGELATAELAVCDELGWRKAATG